MLAASNSEATICSRHRCKDNVMARPDTNLRATCLAIGVLSERTGVNIETTRCYERIGLLPKPDRTAGRHRSYAPEHVATLAFIRRARELGFPLETIRDLIRLNAEGACCETARDVTAAHRRDIRRKIADLRKLDRALSVLIDERHPGKQPSCPIMNALAARQP
ncbi:MAG: MerR family DNA-binding protein [Hyphomicrobiaceae bacterium]